jgi:PAS domain S-box-containing protein
MSSAFSRAFRERFAVKVLLAFAVGIVVSLAVFTVVTVLREGDRLKQGLRERGETYASFLSQGAVIGIFSENEDLLRQAASGVLAARDVVTVSLYNEDLKLLYRGTGTSALRGTLSGPAAAPSPVPGSLTPRTVETDGVIEVVLPVTSALPAGRDEALYFGPAEGEASARVLGYVQVVLSKASYRKDIFEIILRNVLLMAAFVVMSLLIVAFTVRRVLRPLERLTAKVKAFQQGTFVEPAPVETRDEVGRLAAALNDMVAARRAAEESLRESEDRYRRLVELSPDAIYVEQDGAIVFINQAGAGLLGADVPSKVVGWRSAERLDAGSRELIGDRMRQVEAEGATLSPFPVRYRRPDGSAVEAEVTAAPFLFRGRRAALVIARDVTERKDLEDKVSAYEKELYAVAAEMTAMEARIEERERYQIAADLHDFVGQNLVLMQFRLGALARSLRSPDDLRRIEELREVIGRTIQYTRTLTVELSPPDLAEIGLSAAVEALAAGFSRAYGIRIAVRDDAGKQQLDRETRYLLYRNVRELLVNMVKHSGATEATVSLARSGDRLRIAVNDNGRGFYPPETPGEKGGFGLFAVRERMERIGGACEIDARPGAGMTVVLTVPAREAGDVAAVPKSRTFNAEQR